MASNSENDVLPSDMSETLNADLFSCDDNGVYLSDTSSEDSDGERCDDLSDELGNWVNKFNIPHNAVRALLAILRPFHPLLPKDPRTLLKTVTQYAISNVNRGQYHQFGMNVGLLQELQQLNCPVPMTDITSVSLQINIDGLPLFRSSSTQFWPVLGRLISPYVYKPFVIGLLCW